MYLLNNQHYYTLAVTGLKKKVIHKNFTSREQANQYMYKLCDKNNLAISKVYDDKHDKTYITNNNDVRFYIQRA